MKTIRTGDVYFLTNPFLGDENDPNQARRLCHLLGTLTERPVVVIRPPMAWDDYGTVTVIPTINKYTPSIAVTSEDRYGRASKSSYNFVPHMPHTLPANRLGKYIGSLDQNELSEMLHAFTWVMDPLMRDDDTVAIPGVYNNLRPNNPIPHEAITPPEFTIKEGGEVSSTTHPEIDGLNVNTACHNIPGAIRGRLSYESAPEHVDVVNKTFPTSLFDTSTLERVAPGFNIVAGFYDGSKKKRTPYILKDHEMQNLRLNLTKDEFDCVLAYYNMMSAFDAEIIGPRVPLQTLAEITGLSRDQAASLKSVCNYMRDLLQTDYDNRIALSRAEDKAKVTQIRAEQLAVQMSEAEYQTMLKKVGPYLTTKGILRMPSDAAEVFMKVPKWRIKRAYKGQKFEQKYTEAVHLYQDMIKDKKGA